MEESVLHYCTILNNIVKYVCVKKPYYNNKKKYVPLYVFFSSVQKKHLIVSVHIENMVIILTYIQVLSLSGKKHSYREKKH